MDDSLKRCSVCGDESLDICDKCGRDVCYQHWAYYPRENCRPSDYPPCTKLCYECYDRQAADAAIAKAEGK